MVLERTKAWGGADHPLIDWRGSHAYQLNAKRRSGCLYQMANRIAHLCFFREVLGIDALLVNLCFLTTLGVRPRMDWDRGLAEAKRNMGTRPIPFQRTYSYPP